ncbi:MAG: hypothetical protein EOP83_18750 [Verrucomicrobiaceae bacterium]|nr:MAG: hypothetical protein EOP83_18750 [Verrucomicrobiaceae bacterium]
MRRASIPALAVVILPLSPATAPGEEEEALPDMIVEADRDSVLPEHFAGSATVIDQETIAKSGVRSVADLLATQGGIRLTSSTGNASSSSPGAVAGESGRITTASAGMEARRMAREG